MTRHQHAGAAVVTTLAGSVAGSGAVTIVINDATGWPDASVGPFAILVSRGTAREEKMLVTARSTTSLTVTSGNRGHDDTTAKAHNSGDDIRVCITAAKIDELDQHANSAASHLGTGTINAASMFASGVVDAAAIGAGAVGSSELASDAVIAGKIADGAIDAAALFGTGVVATAAIADGAVTPAKVALDEVRLRRASNQSIGATTATTISWDTEDADIAGYIAVTGDTLTVPAGKGGIHIITVDVAANGVAPLEVGIQFLNESGGPVIYSGLSELTKSAHTMVRRMADGATMRGWVFNPSSATTFTAKLTMVRLGA